MSLNKDQYYTAGRSFVSKGNKSMLNAIDRNAYKPTRKLGGSKKSFVNPELEEMKCGGKVHKMEEGGELPMYGNGDETKWRKTLQKSGEDLLAFAQKKGMTYEDAFKEKDNYWTGAGDTTDAFLALGQPEPYRYAEVELPTKAGGTKIFRVPMYDGNVWKAAAQPMFTKTMTKLSTPSYEQAYENVDKNKYPTLESFVADAEFYKKHGRNMTPEERAGAVAESTGRPQGDVVPKFDTLPNKQEISTQQPSNEDDDLPEGFNYWYVEGEKGYLDPEVYGYAQSDMPRQLSQPGINKGHLKRQMEEYAKTGQYPWGARYKFQDGGQLPIMKNGDDNISLGPAYDSRYGFMGKLAYDKTFRGQRDRSTQHILSGDIYGGGFGMGISGAHKFGTERRYVPAFNFAQNRLGFDKVRGAHYDFSGGADIHILDDRYKGKFDVTPYGGVWAQSKADPKSIDAKDLGSKVGLNYGLGLKYSKNLGGGKFNVEGSISGSPSLGKLLSEKKAQSENIEFAPQFNIGASYSLPVGKTIKNMKRLAAAKKKDIKPRDPKLVDNGRSTAKFLQTGGEVMELTDKEIQKLRAGGHIVIES